MPSLSEEPRSPTRKESVETASAHPPHRDKWLVLIGALKILYAFVFVLLGLGAIRLLHRSLVAFVNHWIVVVLRFDPASHFVNFILNKAALVSPHQLRMFSDVIFIYAGLDLIEGIGLVMEKVWAEYVTLVITAAFLPVEFYELVLHVSAFKIGLVLANAVIVLYLLWLVQAGARRRMHRLVHRKSRQ
jgi:uncharacterized membrane protein (DUF2068 family)